MLAAALSNRIRRVFAAILVLGLTAVGMVVGTPAARAVSFVTVSGTVTQELSGGGYAAVSGAKVTLYPLHGSGDAFGTSTTTSTGAWSMGSVPTGTYRVYFAPPASATEPHAAEWWGGIYYEASGNTLNVVSSNVSGVNASLELGSTISGTVTTGGSGALAAAAAFLWDPFTRQFARFSSRAVTNSSGAYTIYGVPPGDYLLRFGDVFDAALTATRYWDEEDYINAAHPLTISDGVNVSGRNGTLTSGGVAIARLAGANRYETSAAISQAGFNPGSTSAVFVVNGATFPDALSAGPAAALVGAPVLLVQTDALPPAIAAELDRLDPDTIVVLGSTASVSAAVETSLHSYATVVQRIAGADRFETSRNVAETFFAGNDNRTAYVATGLDFPNALAAGAAAANEFGPLILVNGTISSLDAPTIDLVANLDLKRLVIVGGVSGIPAGIEASAALQPSVTEVYRRDGADRFDTGVKTNRASFSVADTVYLTTGLNFPDALSGTALAGSLNKRAPMYLVRPDCVPVGVLNEINRLHPKDIVLLGSEASLDSNVFNLVPCA